MIFLQKKWASLSLILTMMISLLSPLTAFAAGTITVTNLYSPAPGVTFVDANVDKFTMNPISLDVLINGIPDDQISNIYYDILNQTTGQSVANTTNKPVKNTSNSSQITFNNVQLSPGLNKIIVKFGTNGGIASSPAYAYYTPVANISNLQFNGVDFVDGGMYPQQGPYTGAAITGRSANATELDATYQANVFQPTAFTNGDFTFITNTGRTTDLSFNPGDNVVTFTSKNLTNLYTATRSFVYDNGKAFAYNALVDLVGGTSPQKLVKSPNLSSNTVSNVAVSADFKNPLTAGGVDKYVSADVTTLGVGSTRLHFDFLAGTVTSTVYGTLNGGATPTTTITKDATLSTNAANIYHFTGQLPVNTQTSLQEVDVTFTDVNTQTTTSKYTFNYVNSSNPYVDHVDLVRTAAGGATSSSTLSQSGTTQITEFPATIRVYTDKNADEVGILLNGVPYITGANAAGRFPTISGTTFNTADIVLQGVKDGSAIMQVIPYKTNVKNQAGIKQYNVVISGAPYVIVNNIYTGMVVDTANKITCTTGVPGPCITGRLINLPTTEYANVVYNLNGVDLLVTPADTTTGIFTINPGDFTTNGSLGFNKDGKYTLKIGLKVAGQLVTTLVTDIFVLTNNVPLINSMKPMEIDPLSPQFIPGSLPDTYITRAATVQLQGQIVNSVITPIAPLTTPATTLYLRKSAATPVVGTITVPLVATPSLPTDPINSQNFNMQTSLSLPEYGNYVFELVSTNNSSGSTATKLVTITREPVPYLFVAPQPNQIIKNSKNVDQVNINQNYYLLKLFADKADSVSFGKDTAIYDKANNFFIYEAKDLKAGANEIKFTVTRGTSKINGSIVLNNINTGIEGAQFKTSISSSMKVFDGDVQINFPKDTKLMRNDRTNNTQYITTDRKILFGIANNDDGRVDKVNESMAGFNILTEPTGHFIPAGKRFWVDAGVVSANANSTVPGLQDAYRGSGILPNTTDPNQLPFYTRIFTDLIVPTMPGTITLKYDKNIRDDSAKYLTIYQYGYFDNPSGIGPSIPGWRNMGGVVDTRSNTITVPIESFGYFQVMYMDESFNDVTNHPWARNDLDTLYTKGIMASKTTGQFFPNDAISRGEFVSMLVKIFDIPLVNEDTSQTTSNSQPTFFDVQKGFILPGSVNNTLYNYLTIQAAARAGVIRGNSNGTFLPNSAITRQDAAVMIARIAELKLTSDETKSLTALQKLFTDAGNIDFYARTAVEAVSKANLIEGKENVLLQGQKKTTLRFDPLENLTRAEAATIAIRVMKQQKKLPK